jgi:hypothetical protein
LLYFDQQPNACDTPQGLFKQYDADGSGELSVKEFKALTKYLLITFVFKAVVFNKES